jgi:predicted DNA binding protein
MPEAKLTLTIPDDIWIGDITRKHPETRVRVLAAIPNELSGIGLAEVSGPSVEAVLAAMVHDDELTNVETLQPHEDEALVQFETTNPLLLLPARGSGLPLTMPFDIHGGEAVWTLTASSDRLSALGEQLDEFGIQYTVEYVQEYRTDDQLLTDRQQELVETAVAEGYYDDPRQCTLTELADHLDIAKSTCSSTLHRAEEVIVKSFVTDNQDQQSPLA